MKNAIVHMIELFAVKMFFVIAARGTRNPQPACQTIGFRFATYYSHASTLSVSTSRAVRATVTDAPAATATAAVLRGSVIDNGRAQQTRDGGRC